MEQCAVQEDLVSEMASTICRRGFAAPAIFMLEAYKPLSGIASQIGMAIAPAISLFGFKRYRDFLSLLEDRQGIENLILAIEQRTADQNGKGR